MIKMSNTFLLLDETYYYSIKGELSFEIICLESLLNDRIILKGLGSIKIKLGCYAKSSDVLLAGNNGIKLNGTYKIDSRELLQSQLDFVNITKVNNLNPNDLPSSNQHHESNMVPTNHLMIIYIVLTLFTVILFIYIIVKSCKFIYLVRKEIKLDREKVNIKNKSKMDKQDIVE